MQDNQWCVNAERPRNYFMSTCLELQALHRINWGLWKGCTTSWNTLYLQANCDDFINRNLFFREGTWLHKTNICHEEDSSVKNLRLICTGIMLKDDYFPHICWHLHTKVHLPCFHSPYLPVPITLLIHFWLIYSMWMRGQCLCLISVLEIFSTLCKIDNKHICCRLLYKATSSSYWVIWLVYVL